MFALIDWNWGASRVVPTTLHETKDDAWEAACRCDEVALYSGASKHPLPGGTRGSRENLTRHGFRVLPVHVEIEISEAREASMALSQRDAETMDRYIKAIHAARAALEPHPDWEKEQLRAEALLAIREASGATPGMEDVYERAERTLGIWTN